MLAPGERVELGDLTDLADPRAPPPREVVGVGVALHERAQREAELRDVLARDVVIPGDAHRPGLGVDAVLEAQRAHAPADVGGLRLEDRAPVAAALQLARGAEAGHAGAHDDDVEPPRRLRHGAHVGEQRQAERGPRGDAEATKELPAGEPAGHRGILSPRAGTPGAGSRGAARAIGQCQARRATR